jgi:hypothetical protein
MNVQYAGETDPIEPYANPVLGLMSCLATIEGAALNQANRLGQGLDPHPERLQSDLEIVLLGVREIRKLLCQLKRETLAGKVYQQTIRATVEVPIVIQGTDLEALL